MNALIDQTFTRIEDVPPAPTIVTIGAFDGVHKGHQHILGLAKARAKALQARLLVLTFEPLPIEIFRPDVFPGRILTPIRRRSLLHRYGADAVVELQFDREMSRVTAGEFLDMLIAIGPIREMWVGHDFALGYKREGTPDRLQDLSRDHGTVVHVVDRIGLNGDQVSSTDVRRLIMDGRALDASRMLGHRFQVSGEVEHGAQLGREIGFPTANVAPPENLVPLKDGIYASYAQVQGDEGHHPAMTYIGTRPAVNTGKRMIETHLFDFDGDLYGQELITEFVQHLRPDRGFPGVDKLIEQLKRDEVMARQVLSGTVPG